MFVLPAGHVQIAFSGGRTSAYMLWRILEANGALPSCAVVTFQNTGREMPETLDFVQEVGARWNVPIVWLEYRPTAPFFEVVSHNSAARNGEPFEALITKRKYLPNQQTRFCTVELKIRTAKRYLMSIGWRHWVNAIGIRADEVQRLVNKDDSKDRWTTLLFSKRYSRREMREFMDRQGELPLSIEGVLCQKDDGECVAW